MTDKSTTMLAIALASAPLSAFGGECEENFNKSGSVFSGTDYSSHVAVPDLSIADAIGQMRGIMVAEKMDVIAENARAGTLLVEQRSTGFKRAVPTMIDVASQGGGVTVKMTVKTEKGQIARQNNIRPYMCSLLARVKGGKEGRLAASKGTKAQNSSAVVAKDVFVFSREIAREAEGNALAVNARHKGRKYSLKGRVDSIQEDGDEYNVSFDIPNESEAILRLPGDDAPRVGVACLFRADQLANVLTFRKGDRATFTGTFLRFDGMQRMVWLQDCTQTKK